MLNQIFHPNNAVFRAIGKLLDVVVLGILWLVCSLPVVTLGASTTALYYSMVKCVRRGEDFPYGNFFRSFRANFRVSLPLSILTAVLWYFLSWGYSIILTLANTQGGTMIALYIAFCVMLLVPIGTLCYAFPLLSRFTFTPLTLLSAAFKLAMRHLPTTVVLVLLLTQAVNLCQRYWYYFFLPLMLCPALLALLFSFFLERIFRPLISPEDSTPADVADEETPWYLR